MLVRGVIIMIENRVKSSMKIVAEHPDLMQPEDYLGAASVKKVRFRLTLSDDGLEILGDSLYVESLENLLRLAGTNPIERCLCG